MHYSNIDDIDKALAPYDIECVHFSLSIIWYNFGSVNKSSKKKEQST